MNKPRKQTIQKYTVFLEDLSKLQRIRKKDLYDKIRKYHLNNSVNTHMLNLGYIENENKEFFKIMLLKVMPIHAVQLLNDLSNARIIAANKKKARESTLTPNTTVIKEGVKKKAVVSNFENKPVKKISLLWGFLYIKW